MAYNMKSLRQEIAPNLCNVHVVIKKKQLLLFSTQVKPLFLDKQRLLTSSSVVMAGWLSHIVSADLIGEI